MSAKWVRSKQWDDRNIPGWAWPVKLILRTLSSITLAVILLSLVVCYAILASVPVGLIVLGLTYLVVGLTLAGTMLVCGLAPMLIMRRVWSPVRAPGWRFAASLIVGLVLAGVGAELWRDLAWPRMMYDPATGTGLRLFASFVDEYSSTTLRRLPGVEMSELEFYSWWPLRAVLLLFVLNMVTATVRRIEFSFPNIGVLTVHTGIVAISLGSVYYKGLKQEGDTLLVAGDPGPDGAITPGQLQDGFYDNTRVVLWVRQDANRWEQRPITVPRYNEYGLGAATRGRTSVVEQLGRASASLDRGRTLDLPVPAWDPVQSKVAADVSLRVVGYAPHVKDQDVGGSGVLPDWVKAEVPISGKTNPVRFCELVARLDEPGAPERRASFFFLPETPAQRIGETEAFGLEYTRAMPAERAKDLMEPLPTGTMHALVVEIPASQNPERAAYRGVFPVKPGEMMKVGETGYTLHVKQIAPQPPFPIITEGYRGATSSVVVVRVTPPPPAPDVVSTAPQTVPFDRWVYHRFPEINQDMLDELNERGMPRRRDADPSIRIAYIDASKLQVYLDEPAGGEDSPVRAIVRQPGGELRVEEGIASGGTVAAVMKGLDVKLNERWAHVEAIERPAVTDPAERKASELGTHERAMLGVEVKADGVGRVVWLPFTKYLGVGMGTERTVELPGGRRLQLAFGRLRYQFPEFLLQLVDFQMIAYDHRGAPRDYQSMVRVLPIHDGTEAPPFKGYTHATKLNEPLQAPFMWSDERGVLGNVAGSLLSRMKPGQFKFSQAGWDASKWQESQKLVDEGKLARPFVRFTILGVGNNPGIHIIAFGGVLMSIGIPWAFYLKPLILRRRKARIAAQVAAGTFRAPTVAGAEA
jgi:hypothetical protein